MAKYRGKHEGKTHGKYVRKALISEQRSLKNNVRLYEELTAIIDRKGVMVDLTFNYDHNGDRYDNVYSRSKSYYVDGVGVGIWRIKDEELCNKDGTTKKLPHAIRIKLVSNDQDSLDAIVKIILDRFPSFKRIGFKRC